MKRAFNNGFVRIFVPTWLLASALGGVGLYRMPGSEYDMVVHFYAALGLFLSVVFIQERWREKRLRPRQLLLVLLGVAVITILWEGFELAMDHIFGTNFSRDTYDKVTDVLSGNLGSAVAFFGILIRNRVKHVNHPLSSRREKEIARV